MVRIDVVQHTAVMMSIVAIGFLVRDISVTSIRLRSCHSIDSRTFTANNILRKSGLDIYYIDGQAVN